MPVYLVHGFRWPREGFTGIRVHIITCNLEDCAVEYIQTEPAAKELLQSFRKAYPDTMSNLENERTGQTLHFVEPYDPADESTISAPHAFVCDRVVVMAAGQDEATQQKSISPVNTRPTTSSTARSSGSPAMTSRSMSGSQSSSYRAHVTSALSISVDQFTSSGPAISPQAWDALAELRDKIAAEESIGWWIVYNGDPERQSPDQVDWEAEEEELDNEEDQEEEFGMDEEGTRTPTQRRTSGYDQILLGQPIPSLLPPGFVVPESAKPVSIDNSLVATAVPHPPPEPRDTSADDTRSKSGNKSFSLPLRRKVSKAKLSIPADEEVPEPPKLKDINKKEGLRQKFFGKKT